MANLLYSGKVQIAISLIMTDNYGKAVSQIQTITLPAYQLAGSTNAATDLATAATALNTQVTNQCTTWGTTTLPNFILGLGS